jgi:predicted nucleic acid-binding Zn ribbon protein
VCHKCNTDNSDYYLKQNENKSNFAVSPELIAGTVTALTTAVGSVAEASASKKMSESELKKEVSVVCGSRRPKLNKKKRAEYDACVKGIRSEIDSRTNQTRTQEQQKELFSQNRKDKRNKTYLIIGLIAVILGVVIYKKMKK